MTSRRLIGVAPNGARRTRADHPALPISPEELAQTAKDIVAAGAGLLHLHVRDEAGRHSLDPARYRDAVSAIRDAVDDKLIIQITTEACGIYSRDEQIATVEALRPEACSVALRELCPSDQATNVQTYAQFLSDCQREGIKVQHILYDEADLWRFRRFWSDGVVPEAHPFILLVIGRYIPHPEHWQPDFLKLMGALHAEGDTMPEWAVCGFGTAQISILTAAAALGGHVRVGFENGLQRPDGSLARNNADLVGICAEAFRNLHLTPMSAADARLMAK
jgi:uncharacterized protein (DUF849 family)